MGLCLEPWTTHNGVRISGKGWALSRIREIRNKYVQ